MPKDDGSAEIFRNLDAISRNLAGAMELGLGAGLRGTSDHIKTEYSRPATGKGFTDRTANLRNSIDSATERVGRYRVEGAVFANEDYAPYVETRHEGRFAFLFPGTMDRANDIVGAVAAAVKPLL